MSLKLFEIAKGLPWIKSISKANDDHYSDRLNHRYTAGLLFICAFVCTTFPYSFNRITCWVPAHFVGAFQKYTNDYCWISNTYYIPVNNTIPDKLLDRQNAEISYYQWVPFILLFSGLMFYFPRMFWRSLNTRSGIDLQGLLAKHNSKAIAASIELYCDPGTTPTSKLAAIFQSLYCTTGKRFGNYLSTLYLMTKFMYLLNSLVQFYFIQHVLGQSGFLYGLSIWRSIFIYNSVLTDSPYFPRITLCDLSVREVGNTHRYTVQCVLPINMLNEKVFSLLWFWFFIVIISNTISFFTEFYQYCMFHTRYSFIRNQYKMSSKSKLNQAENERLQSFTQTYLERDGVLILRIIDQNTDAFLVPQVLEILYDEWIRTKLVKAEPTYPTSNQDSFYDQNESIPFRTETEPLARSIKPNYDENDDSSV